MSRGRACRSWNWWRLRECAAIPGFVKFRGGLRAAAQYATAKRDCASLVSVGVHFPSRNYPLRDTEPTAAARRRIFRVYSWPPFRRSSSATSLWPAAAAIFRAVPPLNLVLALTSAPLASSSSTTSLWPADAAKCRGVVPFLSLALTSALLARSSSATPLWPLASRRHVQACDAVVVLGVDFSPVGQQQFHYVPAVLDRRKLQRRRAIVGLGIDVGFIGQQQFRHVLAATSRRHVQRRRACVLRGQNQIGIVFEQRLDPSQVAIPRRVVNLATEGKTAPNQSDQRDGGAPAKEGAHTHGYSEFPHKFTRTWRRAGCPPPKQT